MARDASITRHFGDAEYLFRMRLKELFELQDKINRPRVALLAAAGVANPQLLGPLSIMRLLASGELWPQEIREIIRIGLVGGGMKPAAADVLLHHHFARYSIIEISELAQAVLDAAIAGDEAALVGKSEAAEPAAAESAERMTGSTGEPSMETESFSGSTPEPSIIFPSPNTRQ